MASKNNKARVRINLSRNPLGKRPARRDPRTLQLANYLNVVGALPAPPVALDYGKQLPPNWGMMANDKIGDCTCAAAGHAIQEWSKVGGEKLITIPDSAVIDAYEAITGYNPKNPKTDRGANELDVLNYWRKSGIGGYRIDAYVGLEPHNADHIKDAIEIFGNCYIGLALPVSAQTQPVWTVPPGGAVGHGAPGSWGGHAVIVVGYDARTLTIVTWGKLQQMTWQFWDTYCDEAYAILCADLWKKNPENLDVTALMEDLQEVAQGAPQEWSIVAKHDAPKPPSGRGRWIPMKDLTHAKHDKASSIAVLTRELSNKLNRAESAEFVASTSHDGIWWPDEDNDGQRRRGYPQIALEPKGRRRGYPQLVGYQTARYIA